MITDYCFGSKALREPPFVKINGFVVVVSACATVGVKIRRIVWETSTIGTRVTLRAGLCGAWQPAVYCGDLLQQIS